MNDKIILESNNKISVSGTSGNRVNEKLKQLQKINIKKELMNLKPKEVEEETLNTNEIANKTKGLAEKTIRVSGTIIKRLFGLKGLLIVGGILAFIFLISAISGSIGSILTIGERSSPNISEENRIKIIELMNQLDTNCGKNLKSGFTLTGVTDTDWKTVLSLLLGYYENDLTTFNESVSNGGSWQNGCVSDEGLLAICTFEGFSSIPYNLNDGAGYTIGFGITSRYDPIHYSQLAPKCTVEQALQVTSDSLKENYAREVLNRLKSSGMDLSKVKQCEFDAWVSFAYNHGSFWDHEIWNMYVHGADKRLIANKWRNTVTMPGSQFHQGLIRRRQIEAEMFLGNYPQVSIYDYGTGTTITNINGISGGNHNNSIIDKIYNLVNEISSDHNKLTRHDFEEVIDKLDFTDEQKEMSLALFEADLWEEIFGENYDYKFKINGSYSANVPNIDFGNLSGSRKAIIETGLKMLGKPYLWGGREYDMSKSPENAGRVDCSGFTGYLMAKVFGATYYNGPATWTQQTYCYQISEAEALPGDIVFNSSCSHTLIYYGKNEQGQNLFLHSPRTGDVIKVSTYGSPVTFWRLKGVNYED